MKYKPRHELPHFATRFIMHCGEALIAGGFIPSEVTSHRAVYQRDRLCLAVEWEPHHQVLMVSFGHRKEVASMVQRTVIGSSYNAFLEAAGLDARLPEKIETDDRIEARLAAAFDVISQTLVSIAERYRELEPRAWSLMRQLQGRGG
jgi:hypothetical protein